MIQRAIVADDGGLADDHSHAVVDEDATSDGCARVDFDAGQPAGDVRAEAGGPVETMMPKPVREAVHDQCMHAGVSRQYFPARSGRRVTFENDADVFFQILQHTIF